MTTSIVPVPDLIDPGAFPAPSPNNAQYNRDAREWADKQKPYADSVVAICQAVRTNALATQVIADDAKTVTGQNKTAAQQAQEAAELAAANAAGSAAFYGRWSELTGPLNMPANVTHAGKDWRLVRNLVNVASAQPGVSDAWEIAEAAGIKRVQRTSNVQLTEADSGKWIDIAAGTFTQTFLAPAALGAGWWCYLQNSGTGDITIPASDGRTNWIMYPGEVRLVQCDGVALRSVVLKSFYKVFTASGTFVKPPGYTLFELYLVGGGSGGGGGQSRIGAASAGGFGGGGRGGSASRGLVPQEMLPIVSSAVVGAGGAGGVGTNTSGSTAGGEGGASTFGALFSTASAAIEFLGARFDAVSTPPNESIPNAGVPGGSGSPGTVGDSIPRTPFPGGQSLMAGNGGAGGRGAEVYSGTLPSDGADGATPGGGGGGGGGGGWAVNGLPGTNGGKGGNGARGEIRIWGII